MTTEAKQIKEGCEKKFCRDCGSEDDFHNESCTEGDLGFVFCGYKDLEEELFLCPICQAKLSQYKSDLQQELEFLEKFLEEAKKELNLNDIKSLWNEINLIKKELGEIKCQ